VGAVVLWVTSGVLFTFAGPALGTPARAVPVLLAALLVHLSALAVAVYGILAVGLMPQSHAYAALAAALLVYQCWHTLVIVGVTAFLVARVGSGLLDSARRVTFANARVLFHYSVAQAVVAAILLYVFPRIPS
jgi:cytochrome c oxidase subunit I+III